jgi:hypothetical protein
MLELKLTDEIDVQISSSVHPGSGGGGVLV